MADLKSHSAFAPVKPKPKGNAQRIAKNRRTGKRFIKNDESVIRSANALILALTILGPPEPLRGAVVVDVDFLLQVPESFPQWKREAAVAGYVFPYSEGDSAGSIPDRGNLLKLLEDCLEKAGWFRNDSQVCFGKVSKRYGEKVGYQVAAREVLEIKTFKAWKAHLALANQQGS